MMASTAPPPAPARRSVPRQNAALSSKARSTALVDAKSTQNSPKRHCGVRHRISSSPAPAFLPQSASSRRMTTADVARHHQELQLASVDLKARLKVARSRKNQCQTRWCRSEEYSLTAFTGRALTIFRAGFTLKVVGSLVKGLMPWRAFVAGFFTTMNLASPGTTNAPLFLSSLWPIAATASITGIAPLNVEIGEAALPALSR